jgi:hypothetical protein
MGGGDPSGIFTETPGEDSVFNDYVKGAKSAVSIPSFFSIFLYLIFLTDADSSQIISESIVSSLSEVKCNDGK